MAMNNRLLRPKASGTWTPARETGLQFWLDANDSSTITLNGSNVSEWRDKSGNGRHATQGTAISQPLYVLAGQNGKNLVTFDGSDDSMNIPATFVAGLSSAFSVYYVILRRGIGTGSVGSDTYAPDLCPVDGASDRGSFHYIKALSSTGASYPFFGSSPSWGSYDNVSGTYSLDTPYVVRFSASATQWQVFKSGTQEGTTQTRGGTPAATITALRICQQANPARAANNSVAEIFWINTPAAGVDDKAEGYLAWKWGFNTSLPSTHPYRNSPPR